jgi:hypothetical protein
METLAEDYIDIDIIPVSIEENIPDDGWEDIGFDNAIENIYEDMDLGLVTGEKSCIIVIEVEDEPRWNELIKNQKMPITPISYTNRKKQYWFEYDDVFNNFINIPGFVKILSNGNIIKVPDKWTESIFEIDPAPIPEFIYNIMYELRNDNLYYQQFLREWNHREVYDTKQFINQFKRVLAMYIGAEPIYVIKSKAGIDVAKLGKIDSILKKYYLNVLRKTDQNETYYSKETFFSIFVENITEFQSDEIIFKPLRPLDTGSGNSIQERQQEEEHVFNIFPGYKGIIKRSYDEKKINLILKHIKEVWADDDVISYDYIIKWLANIVQRGCKNGTALVFVSKQGSGKNIIGNFLCDKVYGTSITGAVNDIKRITSRFNKILAHKVLTILDEVSSVEGGSRRIYDKMKSLITESTQYIEKKGIDTIKIADYNNYILFSNNQKPLRIEESDRRYAMFRMSDKYKGMTAYFQRLGEQLESGDDFITYLNSLDLSSFSVSEFPETKFKIDQISASRDDVCIFLEELKDEIGGTWISSGELYGIYIKWAETRRATKHSLIRLNRAMMGQVKRQKQGDIRGYILL